ncbi:hypothetical protein [Ottowia sp.]|uniref:hypothetical protein n=1 Tax=Ottowia sp. TaxID=1898956 RepID=UPI00262E52B2|nr:hypothetical protein [Ottowia sp.]
MKDVIWLIILTIFIVCTHVSAGELDLKVSDNISQEWKRTAEEYRTRIDGLRDKRKKSGEKKQAAADLLDSINFAKTSEQAQKDFAESYGKMLKSSGDFGVEYLKGIGKRSSNAKAGEIVLEKILPPLDKMYKAVWSVADTEYYADELRHELNRYDRNIEHLNRKIEEMEKSAELSEKIAATYEELDKKTRDSTKPILTNLKQIAVSAKQSAQEKHDTVPVGWVACNCPRDHASYGRVINGTRYHLPDVRCP